MHRHWWSIFVKRHSRRHHHHHHKMVLLTLNGVSILLTPNQGTVIMSDISLGHGIDLAIAFLDASGNPMITPPTPDATPSWTQTTPATENLSVDPGGLTAHTRSIAVGSDSIGLSVVVGGATFAATLAVNVAAPAQVLTSVAIVPTVV